MEFKDISMEASRIYTLRDGLTYDIANPMKLHVAASGSHRVEGEDGRLHYIAPGFLAIEIELKPGHKGFSF